MKEKTKLYEKLLKISERGVLNEFTFLLKTSLFHSIVNAIMSNFNVAAFLCLTNTFGVDKVDVNEFIFKVLLLPSLVAVILACVVSISIILISIDLACKIIDNSEKYDIKKIKKSYFIVSIVGTISYCISSGLALLSAHIFVLNNTVSNTKSFYVIGISMALILGIIWNRASYLRHLRPSYKDLFGIKDENCKRKSFYLMLKQCFYEILGCISTIAAMALYYTRVEAPTGDVSLYNLFYIIYFTVLGVYVRYVYKWEFSFKNVTIYPTKSCFK